MLGVFAVLVALILVAPFLARVFGETELPGNPLEPLARSPDPYEAVMFKNLALALAPLAEEVLFRGLLYNALRQRFPVILAVVLPAVVFGLLHPLTDQRGTRRRGRSGLGRHVRMARALLAQVLMHAFTNGVMLVLMAWGLTAARTLHGWGWSARRMNGAVWSARWFQEVPRKKPAYEQAMWSPPWTEAGHGFCRSVPDDSRQEVER